MTLDKEQLIFMLTKEGVVAIDGSPLPEYFCCYFSIESLSPVVIKKINIHFFECRVAYQHKQGDT